MRKKTKNMIVIGLACAMLSGVLSGCGKEAKAVVNQQNEETGENTNNEPGTTEVVGSNAEEMAGTDKDNIVFNEEKVETKRKISRDLLRPLDEMVSFKLNKDTDFYDTEGHIVGYIKAGSTVTFNLMHPNTRWYAFNWEDDTVILMAMNDIEKSIKEVEPSDTPASTETATTSDAFAGAEDDNIILYSDSSVEKLVQSGQIDFNYGKVIENLTYEKDEILIVNTGDILLYNGNGENVGCMKTNGKVTITEVSSDSNWARFKNPIPDTKYDYLYLTKSSLLRYGTSTNTSIKEVPKTENKENTENNVTINPTPEVPVYSEPVTEQPVVAESDKYTPEEAVAVYKNTILAEGIDWDPSIKEFASWGTGFISITDPVSAAQDELEGIAFAKDTRYYFEVTGSDGNYVYITVWGCD